MLALATGYGHSKKHGKGHKGVKGHSGHKGHKGKKSGKKHEDHWAKHSNAKGKHSKGHHDSKKYHGDHHKGSKGHKGAKFGKKGHKHKGHVTKGFKNTYHKNEFSKKTKFYDSFDNGGYHKKFGGYKGHYGGSKGNKFKGGKLSGFFKGGKFGKKHHLDKGKHFDEHKGSKGSYEEKGSYGHKSEHKKGGGGKKHKGYGHKHGHDHGYGHSGHTPVYVPPHHLQRRQDDGGYPNQRGDEYDEDYGDYNGYDESLEAEQKKLLNEKKGEVGGGQEQEEPQEDEDQGQEQRTYTSHSNHEPNNQNEQDSSDKDEDERINPREYHQDYYPKDDKYKMVGGYYASHHPPSEQNFDSDHTELEEKSNIGFKKPKANIYTFGSYDEDPEYQVVGKYVQDKPQAKSDEQDDELNLLTSEKDKLEQHSEEVAENAYPEERARSRPSYDEIRPRKSNDGEEITNAFRHEWTHNPDDEITKQVIGYFQDDKDEHTTKKPFIRKTLTPPIPSSLSPSPLSRMSYQGNLIHPAKNIPMPNSYHPFSGFYYKNKFNS